MSILITTNFGFELNEPTDVLMQFEAARLDEQQVIEAQSNVTETLHLSRIAGNDGVGERIWLHGEGRIEVNYLATVQPDRVLAPLATLDQMPLHQLPAEAALYLFDSRYCHSDQYQGLVADEFAGTAGGIRIVAIRDWISHHFEYVPGASDVRTDATDSFIARKGVCRDYAHVLIALARASGIPARYVACYAPGVTPQDFHAVVEVFLADPKAESGGAWHMVDATKMADIAQAAKIAIGRDAADVSFLTSFAPMQFLYSAVDVSTAGEGS